MIESARDVFPYLLLTAASAITADAVWDLLRVRRRRLMIREASEKAEADLQIAWHRHTQQLPEDPGVALLGSPFRHLLQFMNEMGSNPVRTRPTTTVNVTEPTPGGSTMATVTITFDTSEDISPLLAALGGGTSAAKAPTKAAAKPAAAKPAPAPSDDDSAADSSEGPTLDDAIERATGLVSEGKAAQVKAALTSVGAKRVSELTDKTIGGFMDALDMA